MVEGVGDIRLAGRVKHYVCALRVVNAGLKKRLVESCLCVPSVQASCKTSKSQDYVCAV